tara:strand:- start:1945 stop:2124 length:180 start_codon:yes stop_codon:yes gene_type:complete
MEFLIDTFIAVFVGVGQHFFVDFLFKPIFWFLEIFQISDEETFTIEEEDRFVPEAGILE